MGMNEELLTGAASSSSPLAGSRSRSRSRSGSRRSSVYLNVYDLTPYNMYAYWFGLGIFHSGLEVHGVEYAFGAHDLPTSGVFQVEPRKCPGFTYRCRISIGTTDLGPAQVRQLMNTMAGEYLGDSYHLLLKNCNHFTDDASRRLTDNGIPAWVNRLATLGWFCRCFLPDCLQLTASDLISELEDSEDSAECKETLDRKSSVGGEDEEVCKLLEHDHNAVVV